MPDTLENIEIPPNQWVDVYALTGLTPGDTLFITNVGEADVKITERPTQPPQNHNAWLLSIRGNRPLQTSDVPSGVWAYCPGTKGLLNVATDSPTVGTIVTRTFTDAVTSPTNFIVDGDVYGSIGLLLVVDIQDTLFTDIVWEVGFPQIDGTKGGTVLTLGMFFDDILQVERDFGVSNTIFPLQARIVRLRSLPQLEDVSIIEVKAKAAGGRVDINNDVSPIGAQLLSQQFLDVVF